MNLKPQDVLVLVKMVVQKKAGTYASLAGELGMSASEVHAATRRAIAAGLADAETRLPKREALAEFLIHGVKYAFPATRGEITRGMPTSYAAPPLSDVISRSTNDIPPVWPDKDGTQRGYTCAPICRSAVHAAKRDALVYEMLALVDAMREGRVRERDLAAKALQKRLGLQ
jgi:hypothetical protein